MKWPDFLAFDQILLNRNSCGTFPERISHTDHCKFDATFWKYPVTAIVFCESKASPKRTTLNCPRTRRSNTNDHHSLSSSVRFSVIHCPRQYIHYSIPPKRDGTFPRSIKLFNFTKMG